MALKVVDDLLEKEMDRKQFLAHAGAAVLAVVGISSVLKSLKGISHESASNGYGSSTYGGALNKNKKG